MKFLFNDPTFSFETLRTMGYAPYGGSDIGEVLYVASQIKEHDFESWYKAWYQMAERKQNQAEEFEKNGETLSASQTYFRAFNYYRSAEFFLHGDPSDDRILSTWKLSRESFRRGLKDSNINYQILSIPYENTTMSGYLYKVDDNPHPLLLVHGGFDSISEELYFQIGAEALKRGYNCLVFDGPGQGDMIREKNIPFRPDWENVVSPVIDYINNDLKLPHTKLFLMGVSFGGLLAPRAAAFDDRIDGLICNDGLYSFQFTAAFKAHSHGKFDINKVEEIIRPLMNEDPQIRWSIENGMFTFGAESIADLFAKTDPYVLDDVADKIKCPTLVCEAENDGFFQGQPKMLFDALDCPKELIKFTEQDGADEHCHLGGLLYSNEKIFEWLDNIK